MRLTTATPIDDLLGLLRYGLAAHDIGAWIALPYALMFPNKVSRLALLDAGIPSVTLPDMLPTASDRAWRTWHFAFNAIPDLPEAMIAGREPFIWTAFCATKPPIRLASARRISTNMSASSPCWAR